MTNPEGRVLLRRKAVDPPPGVRSDLQIWRGIADRLGRGQFFPTEPRGGLRRAAPGQRGRDRRLRRDHLPAPRRGGGAVLAVPDRGPPRHPAHVHRALRHAGRPRQLPAGRARGSPPSCPTRTTRTCSPPAAPASQYQSGTQTRRSPTLAAAVPRPYVELHPELARAHGIAEGDPVRLSTPRGSAVLDARLDPGIRRDTVFVAVPLGRRGVRQRADQRRARPDVADAGVQDLPRRRREGRRRRLTSTTAAAVGPAAART